MTDQDLSFEASYKRLDTLVNVQAVKINEMELELGIKSLRAMEKMIKHASKSGDGVLLKMLLEERNRKSDYLHNINK